MTGTSPHAPHHLSSVPPPRTRRRGGQRTAPPRPPRNPPYYEDRSPGSGALPPRAWYARSDAARLSLHGTWRFRLSATRHRRGRRRSPGRTSTTRSGRSCGCPATGRSGRFAAEGSYGAAPAQPAGRPRTPTPLPLPGRSAAGAGREPDRATTGASSTCPTAGREGPAVLHFDGVESCARVWLNGRGAGPLQGQPAAARVRGRARCCGRAAMCWRCGSTSGRRAATWRTRTSGGCPASSGTSRSTAVPRARSPTTSCTPGSTTSPATAPCGWTAHRPAG